MEQIRRNKKKKIKPAKLIFKIIGYAIILLIAAFVCFQIYRALDSQLTTEPALEYTIYDSINVDGFVVRDEEVINGQTSGVLTFEIDNAEVVKKDGVIANIYPDEQSLKIKEEISLLEAEIEQLEQVETSNGTSPSLIDKQIDEKFDKYLEYIENGEIEDIDEMGLQLLQLFNKRQVTTNEESMTSITNRLNQLKQKKKDLESQLTVSPSSITSPQSGYFSHNVDGCEDLVDYANVTDMTIDEFSLLPEKIERVSDENIIGKIIKQYTWYYVFEIPQESLSNLKNGMTVDVVFSGSSKESVPMTLVAINSPTGDSNVKGTIGVFKCSIMNEDIMSLRRVSAQVQLKKYSGLRVNSDAIRFNENNQMGVYVLEGNTINFKLINPIYTGETFVICGDMPQDEQTIEEQLESEEIAETNENEQAEGYSYLSRYDEIITEGKDLKHGAVISNF